MAPGLGFPDPLIEPDVLISRIRLSDWFHVKACKVDTPRRPHNSFLWSVRIFSGVARLIANPLSSAPSEAPRTGAPSLHQHYPASPVL